MSTPKMKIPIAKPWFPNVPRALKLVGEVLESGWVSRGPKDQEFERRFAAAHSVKHALTTTSCTTALHLALVELGLKPGDEVIVPSFTYIASANAVSYCGATPVLVDVDLATFNVSPDAIRAAITGRTVGIMPVHLFGLCADMDPILEIAREYKLFIVEDCACATGSSYHGRFAGSFGEFGAFSLHARKSITCGEGGVLTTNDSDRFHRAAVLHSHAGKVSDVERHEKGEFALPDFDDVGYNYRLADPLGAIALAQLEVMDELITRRQAIARRYDEALAPLAASIRTPHVPSGCVHTYQSYVLTVADTAPLSRDALARELIAQGVSVRVGTHAVHLQNYYRDRYSYQPEDIPQAWKADQRSLAIPLFPQMTDDEQTYVIDTLYTVLRNAPHSQEALA